MGSGLLGLLAVALWLEPDPRGFGTHQQLGLPPCTFSTIFGFRCPSCGMTTSWSHTVRGQLLAAAQANTGGVMLALLAISVGPWLLVSGVRGCWIGWNPNAWAGVFVGGFVLVVTVVDWVWRSLWVE